MMTLNGMFSEPKPHRINFIKENKRKLKQISSLVNQNINCSNVDLAKCQSSQTDVGRQLHSSSSKINTKSTSSGRLNRKSTITVFMRDKRNNDIASTTALFPPKSSCRSVSVTKNQSCQTIDPKNYDQLFHEGVIIYPSSKVLQEIAELERQKTNRLDVHVKKDFFKKNRLKSNSPTNIKTNLREAKKEQDENTKSEEQENKSPDNENPSKKKESVTKITGKQKIKEANPALNAAEIIQKTTEDHLHYSPRNHHQYQELVKPSNRGDSNATPKLMKKSFTKKNKKEDNEVLKTVLDPVCPPGHIPLPDQERKKTLHMLRVSYAELIREMNLLPVRTDTLRIRQRKIQLENQLNKIEEGIKVFNKSKVYVKIDE